MREKKRAVNLSTATFEADALSTLRGVGLRVTPIRLQVLQTLHRSRRPMSIKGLLAHMGKNAPDQVTLYRTLTTFVTTGLVRRVDLQHGHAHYELHDPHNEHHHLVCVSCGRVEDFHTCKINDMLPTALREASDFARVTSHSLELYGICKSCMRKTTPRTRHTHLQTK